MDKRYLHIVSPELGSIGEITKDLVNGLEPYFHITVETKDEPEFDDILLCHFIEPRILTSDEFKKFKKRVLIQPIDGTEIKKEVIANFNKFDLIITPGNAGRDIMIKNGVTVPIEVIPNFYKNDLYSLPINSEISQIPKNKVVFYHESTFHPRKGIEIMYEAFVKAFSDTDAAKDVVLVCKDMPFNELTFDKIEGLKRDVMDLQKTYKNPARIIKISQRCEWEMLKKLWCRADIYVSCAKIEGFGIPLLRMAVYEKPIIILENYNSGYMDYLNSENSYMIPTIQITAKDEFMYLYEKTTEWAIPKRIDDAVLAFKQAYKDFKNNSSKVVSEKTLEVMKYENVMKKYVDVLKKK